MITASNLLFRIGILTPTVTRDEYGAQVTRYDLTRTVAADVKYNKGRRILEHGELWLPTTIGVTTRLHPDLTEHCRILWDGKTYQIDSLNRNHFEGSITIVASKIDEGEGPEDSGGGSGSGSGSGSGE